MGDLTAYLNRCFQRRSRNKIYKVDRFGRPNKGINT